MTAPLDGILGQSAVLQELLDELALLAETQLPVLLLGETGVGKELFARRLHRLSQRGNKPLVQVNCAALPEALVESELFGHVKGAFSGATHDRAGRFDAANGGTLFLDARSVELPLEHPGQAAAYPGEWRDPAPGRRSAIACGCPHHRRHQSPPARPREPRNRSAPRRLWALDAHASSQGLILSSPGSSLCLPGVATRRNRFHRTIRPA